jgi:CubicO group peptidase (beta-lactamase class C family)
MKGLPSWLKVSLGALAILAPRFVDSQLRPDRSETQLRKPDAVTTDELQRRIPELLQESMVPGLSLALIRDGKTYWVHGFGVRDLKTGKPVTEETIFEAASLSKPVFAYGVLKLVEQGKLDLDAPLTKYLPKPYVEGDPRLERITARCVLSHRTGFPNWRGEGNPLTIHFTPGERFSYSGEGFVYLQRVVEQVTGMTLNEYMTEAVFQPLGMTSSSYVWRADYDLRTATGHDAAGEPGEKRKPKEANAAASLHTTAGDYALFIEALMNGTGLKRKTLQEMEEPQIAVNPECTNCTEQTTKELSKSVFWGLGVGIEETKQGEALWHWGDNGQFKCYMVAYPKQKIGVVLFADGENGLAIASEVVREAIGGEQPAFRWIKYDSYDSPGMQFTKIARTKGAKPAIAEFYPALVRGDISERSINATGYQLMAMNKIADATRVFQLNVALHGNSANVYDSLAEAYMKNGDQELAILNYQRSLDLDPGNKNAAKMLKQLRANLEK